MKILKDMAVVLASAMVITAVPMSISAEPIENDSVVDTPTATAEPSQTEEPAADPTPAPTDEPIISPEPSDEPTETEAPTTTPDATVTQTPAPTATATANPNGKFSITIEDTDHASITVSPKTATKGTKVAVLGNSDRGYRLSKVSYAYTDDDTEKEKTLLTKLSHSIDETFTMPQSNVVIKSEVAELSAKEVVTDANEQVGDAGELNSKYTSTYINNSSNYTSSDISAMKKYISSSKSLIADINNAVSELSAAIKQNDLTKSLMKEVISLQTELDKVIDKMNDLSVDMGGEEVDSFDMSVLVSKGGKVTVSGLVSGNINASSKQNEMEFEDIETDGMSSLSFTFTATSGYSLSTVKINGKSVSVSGNKLTIKPSSIASYVKNGYMDVVVNFSYTGFGNTSGNTSGGYGGGMSAGYGDSSSSTNSNTNNNTAMTTPIKGFSDLSEAEWATEAINALNNLGIINGMSDGVFAPQLTVTREQFAKMIVGVMGYTVDENATTSFSDANGAWYTPYIAAAVDSGIITGRDNGTFGVGENITRQDMAVIIFRALGLSAGEIHEFTDSAEISDYAIDAVSALYNMGIISGYTDGSFGPKNNASRAEAAKMLYSVYNAK